MIKRTTIFLLILALFFSPSPLYAQEKLQGHVDYQLPYPGILPDSAIYPLKIIRDKIAGFFIGKPLKKAEFDLEKADTRISAAITLIEQKKNTSLAVSTLSEAEDYFNEALKKTNEAKDQGMDTRDFVKRLIAANRKHEEIALKIESKIGKKDKNKFTLLKKRIEAFAKEVKKIR